MSLSYREKRSEDFYPTVGQINQLLQNVSDHSRELTLFRSQILSNKTKLMHEYTDLYHQLRKYLIS